MRRATPRFLTPALLLFALGGACDSKTASDADPSPEEIEISSSLEGMDTLPAHVRWLAAVSPEDDVDAVEFLVDGSRLWVDEDAPYSYGEEGAVLGTQRFYRGPDAKLHFTVKALLSDGRTRREFVLAGVPAPMENSKKAPVFGIWGRASPSYLRNPPPPGKWGPFTSNLVLHPHDLWVGRSIEHAFMYESWADDRLIHVGLPVFRSSGSQGWAFPEAQCAPTGSEATYRWSFTKGRLVGRWQGKDQYAGYLVLEAENEPCEPRRRILAGVWEGLD